MNPKTKKVLIIGGLALDALVTITLFVFSIILLANMPESKMDIDRESFLGWFQIDPIRILLLDVLPLALLLALNITITFTYIKKTGPQKEKKQVTLNDLSDEEKEALRKKILQEMLEESNNK